MMNIRINDKNINKSVKKVLTIIKYSNIILNINLIYLIETFQVLLPGNIFVKDRNYYIGRP